MSHFIKSNGIASGTTYPQTISYAGASVGMIPVLLNSIDKIKAIATPDRVAAHLYLRKKKNNKRT